MKTSSFLFNVHLYTPQRYPTDNEDVKNLPNNKLKKLLEETVENFIRENYPYRNTMLGICSRDCGYYIEEVEEPPYPGKTLKEQLVNSWDEIDKFKNDDLIINTSTNEKDTSSIIPIFNKYNFN